MQIALAMSKLPSVAMEAREIVKYLILTRENYTLLAG